MIRDLSDLRCPLYPQKRTLIGGSGMSANNRYGGKSELFGKGMKHP